VNSTTPDGSFSIDGPHGEAIAKITDWLEQTGKGKKAVHYKLRDWLFSRQRYWGEPFPVIWVDGEAQALPEQHAARSGCREQGLPAARRRRASEGPLARLATGCRPTDPESGKPARRETNTMPQWAARAGTTCAISIRRIPIAWSIPERERRMPVDLYLGWREHAVLHLLYARSGTRCCSTSGW
jgi:leucyl-tRNA synthetase